VPNAGAIAGMIHTLLSKVTLNLCFTGLLVVVGFIQAKILGVTLKRNRLTERAWVSIDNRLEVKGFDQLDEFRKKLPDVLKHIDNPDWVMRIRVNYAFVNSGKTPAHIVEMGLVFRNVVEAKLPAEPNYLGIGRKITVILPPGRPFATVAFLPLFAKDMVEILNRRTIIIFYGYVIYLDIFGKRHESRYCEIARILPIDDLLPYFQIDGPEAYNRFS
jgi:hypothetical protein